MAISPITNYKEFCGEFVPEQYRRSEKFLGLLALLFEQCDSLESAFWELLGCLNIEVAEGPALDFIGALVGVERVPGQTDEAYRERILDGNKSVGLPTPESLRKCLQLVIGRNVGLFPVWPAAMYVVVDGSTDADFASLEAQYMTSGCALGRGTFICGEPDDDVLLFDCGYLVDEDHGQPIVCDYRVPDTLYELVTDANEVLVNENNQELVALDYLTITPP